MRACVFLCPMREIQAAFDRDELETDFRQLEKEHMHLQRVFALHFQRTLSDTERIEYEQLTAEYEQQVEVSVLRLIFFSCHSWS